MKKIPMIIITVISLISTLFNSTSLATEIEEKLDSDFQTYVVSFKHGQFYIPYKITGGTLDYIKPIEDLISLEISLKTFEDGFLTLDLPRKFFDTYEPQQKFIIIDTTGKDIKEITFNENSTIARRILTMPVSKNTTKIEILNTGIPEHFPFRYEKSDYDYLFSPMKQLKNGIAPEEVFCRDDLELILKSSNNSPICVKTDTVMKLLKREWGYVPN